MKRKQYWFLWSMILVIGFASILIDHRNLVVLQPARRTLGVSYMTMNNPFYPVLNNELVKAIEGKGDRLVLRDPLLDDQKQAEQIEEFIEMGVDGIFVNPVDSKTILPVLEKAAAKQIPVVVVDCPVDQADFVISQIYSDNYQAGVLCAKDLISRYEGGEILLLKHSSVDSGLQRITGFVETIAKAPQFKIVNERECYGQTETAMPAVLEMLEQTPDANFVVCLNDPSAIGAVAAAEFLKRPDLKVYGVDGMPDFKILLSTPGNAEATAVQSPYTMAGKAAECMYDWLDGKQVEKEIIIPVSLLNRMNAAQNDLRSWQ